MTPTLTQRENLKCPSSSWSALLLLLALVAASIGCSNWSEAERASSPELERFKLESIYLDCGLAGRYAIFLPAGECVVYRHPPSAAELPDLTPVFVGDPSDDTDNGELYTEDPTSYWGQKMQWDDESQSTFNCCTYAVADVVGLSVNDWVEPRANSSTGFQIPIEVILNSYYELVSVETIPVNWSGLQQDKALHEGDVVCYVDNRASTVFAHVGRISKKNNANWMVSKLGLGPVVRATMQVTASGYSDQFSEVRIYRKNS